MSLPRQVLPGTTYLVTRRCTQRQFLLRPGGLTNSVFRFCLGFASNCFGIQLHAYTVLSNHYHLVLTDSEGRLPAFMHWLNEYVAKCLNTALGRSESFWAPGSYSAVHLVAQEDVLDRMVYVYTNPVAAGLVRSSADWPGARSLPEDLGAPPETIARPTGFFRTDGRVPETVELRLVVPSGLGRSDAVRILEKMKEDREQELRAEMKSRGKPFLGVRRVLAQLPWDRAETSEPRGGPNPRFACRDKRKRIEALLRLRDFLHAYRDARKRYVEGDREVRFPWGTYWMRIHLGVHCCGP